MISNLSSSFQDIPKKHKKETVLMERKETEKKASLRIQMTMIMKTVMMI